MISFKKASVFLILSGALLALTACTDYVGKEKTHPLFVKGGNCKASGNYSDAVKAYEEFLTIAPKSAKTHYELATIYGDNLEDPLKAVFHYQKFAELSDPNSPDAQNIREFIDLGKRKLYDKYKTEFNDPAADGTLNALKQENEALRNKLKAYVSYSEKLFNRNTELKTRLRELINEHNARAGASGRGRTNSASSSSAASSPAGTATTTDPLAHVVSSGRTASTADTYKVKSGDTLMKISRTVYGSGAHYKHILNANKDILGENGNKLKVGQVLKVPALPGAGQ